MFVFIICAPDHGVQHELSGVSGAVHLQCWKMFANLFFSYSMLVAASTKTCQLWHCKKPKREVQKSSGEKAQSSPLGTRNSRCMQMSATAATVAAPAHKVMHLWAEETGHPDCKTEMEAMAWMKFAYACTRYVSILLFVCFARLESLESFNYEFRLDKTWHKFAHMNLRDILGCKRIVLSVHRRQRRKELNVWPQYNNSSISCLRAHATARPGMHFFCSQHATLSLCMFWWTPRAWIVSATLQHRWGKVATAGAHSGRAEYLSIDVCQHICGKDTMIHDHTQQQENGVQEVARK